jgi:hypothetical protein
MQDQIVAKKFVLQHVLVMVNAVLMEIVFVISFGLE